MTLHCKTPRWLVGPSFDRASARVCEQVRVCHDLPLSAGWYRLTISGLEADETVELRLDFGLGFIGHHGVRARAMMGEASLFVRLFKQLSSVQLLRTSTPAPRQPDPQVTFQPVGRYEVWRRRALEQVHLLKRALIKAPLGSNLHDQPYRLWGWWGLLAFPEGLPAIGESSYALWRRVLQREATEVPARSLAGWLVIIDCRESGLPSDGARGLIELAKTAGARSAMIASRDHAKSLNGPGVLVIDPVEGAAILRDAIEGAEGIIIIAADVALDPEALMTFASVAEADKVAVVYSDSDYRDARGRRFGPELRTSFSIERLKSERWLGGVLAIRAQGMRALLCQQPKDKVPEVHELCLGISQNSDPGAFVHIPRVLYSRRGPPPRVNTPAVRKSGADGWRGKTTVIIPTRNGGDLLRRCVNSILDRTKPGLLEIILHDNASDHPATLSLLEQFGTREGIVVRHDALPFNFSRINNEAATFASGDLLIFLNDDTEVLTPDWIERLGEVAVDHSVGCAGALLLGIDGRIQHAGLIVGPGGIAGHLHAGLRVDCVDPNAPIIRRDVSAVTGACMAIEKTKFIQAGGFDTAGLAVAFNDVDLCLRLERLGYRNVFVPEARLMHIGSATREDENFTHGSDRFRSEFNLMRQRWGSRLDFDPFLSEHVRLAKSRPQMRLA